MYESLTTGGLLACYGLAALERAAGAFRLPGAYLLIFDLTINPETAAYFVCIATACGGSAGAETSLRLITPLTPSVD
jgi:hypothetical protein